jgi:hypothetical protein
MCVCVCLCVYMCLYIYTHIQKKKGKYWHAYNVLLFESGYGEKEAPISQSVFAFTTLKESQLLCCEDTMIYIDKSELRMCETAETSLHKHH